MKRRPKTPNELAERIIRALDEKRIDDVGHLLAVRIDENHPQFVTIYGPFSTPKQAKLHLKKFSLRPTKWITFPMFNPNSPNLGDQAEAEFKAAAAAQKEQARDETKARRRLRSVS